ncbi:hypothetical protein QU755_21830, partial [Pseudomonas wenzhouensis]
VEGRLLIHRGFTGHACRPHEKSGLEQELMQAYPEIALRLDDIFYCTINDLEDLARGHAAGIVDFFDLIDSATTAGISGAERRMIFQQVILERLKGAADRHESLMKEMDRYLEDMRCVAKRNNEFWSGKAMSLMATREHLLRALNLKKGQF